MAVEKGLCKNCGSLVMFNTADEECECIFCNAVFPLGEVIDINAELKDVVFPNEKYEKSSKSNIYRMPVNEAVSAAVEREVKKNERVSKQVDEVRYEVTAKDVKAPKKVVIIMSSIAVAAVLIIVGITLPFYFTRKNIQKHINENISMVIQDAITVDMECDDNGNYAGVSFSGDRCQNAFFVTADSVDEATANQLFQNYASVRNSYKNYGTKDITVKIYADKGIYTVTDKGATFIDNKIEMIKK